MRVNLYDSYGPRNPYELTHTDYLICKCFFKKKFKNVFLIHKKYTDKIMRMSYIKINYHETYYSNLQAH